MKSEILNNININKWKMFFARTPPKHEEVAYFWEWMSDSSVGWICHWGRQPVCLQSAVLRNGIKHMHTYLPVE